MSAHAVEVSRILQTHFGRSRRDAEWLAGSASLNIAPRTDRDERELALAQAQALQNLMQESKR